jgi:hypothetical protein
MDYYLCTVQHSTTTSSYATAGIVLITYDVNSIFVCAKKLLSACPVLFPEKFFMPFGHNFGGLNNYCCNKSSRVYHILCMSVPIFLYLISLRVSLFFTFISDGIATSVSNQDLSFLMFFLTYLPGPLLLFLSLSSIELSYLAVLLLT